MCILFNCEVLDVFLIAVIPSTLELMSSVWWTYRCNEFVTELDSLGYTRSKLFTKHERKI